MATTEQKLSVRAAITNPTSASIGYVVDSSTSYQATLGNISKGIIVTNLDVTGLTASELIRLNSGGTALESAGVSVTDFVTLTGTQTLTNKTLTSPVLTTPQINDTSADHQYIFGVSELSADRTVTLPLLTGNDTFVFADFAQTLTNKTLTSPTINTPTITTPVVKTAVSLGTLGSTETIDWSSGDLQQGTLDENVTLDFSNAVAGQRLTLFLLQDGSGTNTISFTPTIVWQDDTVPTWTTTADKMNVMVIYYSGSAYFGMGAKFA